MFVSIISLCFETELMTTDDAYANALLRGMTSGGLHARNGVLVCVLSYTTGATSYFRTPNIIILCECHECLVDE